ncbi:MAG: hypothetical protein IT461_15235 [Planctomycetes bacterium]|nr:hypothetical protein [Planctomycetota bacterium]
MNAFKLIAAVVAAYLGGLSGALLLQSSSTAQDGDAPAKKMVVEQLQIVDGKGKKRIVMGVDKGDAVIYLCNADEKPQVAISAGQDSTFIELFATDKSGSIRATVKGLDASIVLSSNERASHTGMFIEQDRTYFSCGQAVGSKAKAIHSAFLGIATDGAFLNLARIDEKTASQNTGVLAKCDKDGDSMLRLTDRDGNPIWKVPDEK